MVLLGGRTICYMYFKCVLIGCSQWATLLLGYHCITVSTCFQAALHWSSKLCVLHSLMVFCLYTNKQIRTRTHTHTHAQRRNKTDSFGLIIAGINEPHGILFEIIGTVSFIEKLSVLRCQRKFWKALAFLQVIKKSIMVTFYFKSFYINDIFGFATSTPQYAFLFSRSVTLYGPTFSWPCEKTIPRTYFRSGPRSDCSCA